MTARCAWVGTDPLLVAYHDEEWGVPELDSRALWEALVLDSFQAGLSWVTILRKRDAFRAAFGGFDPHLVARYGSAEVERLMQNEGVVRSQPKILAAIENARAYVAMEAAGEDLASLVWSAFSAPLQPANEVEMVLALSDALRARGFTFVGPVIVHAWLQGAGAINEHDEDCFRCAALSRLLPL